VAQAVDKRHAAWEADLPLGEDAALWNFVTKPDQARRLSLLARCLGDTYLNRVPKARNFEVVCEAKRGGDCTVP
jgi:hypothetical protein